MSDDTKNNSDWRRGLVAAKAAAWIGSADTKAIAGLTIQSVVIGLVLLDDASNEPGLWMSVAYWAFLAAAVSGGWACLSVLWPRVDRNAMLGTRSRLDASPTYFGDVAGETYSDFRGKVPSPEELAEDETEQAYILARIASVKMARAKLAFMLVGLTLLMLGVLGVTKFHAGTAEHTATEGCEINQNSFSSGEG